MSSATARDPALRSRITTLRDETAMLYALLALMAPLWDQTATHGEATGASVSRLLLVAAAALAAVLAILLADLHHDELRALGLVGDDASISAIFLGP